MKNYKYTTVVNGTDLDSKPTLLRDIVLNALLNFGYKDVHVTIKERFSQSFQEVDFKSFLRDLHNDKTSEEKVRSEATIHVFLFKRGEHEYEVDVKREGVTRSLATADLSVIPLNGLNLRVSAKTYNTHGLLGRRENTRQGNRAQHVRGAAEQKTNTNTNDVVSYDTRIASYS